MFVWHIDSTVTYDSYKTTFYFFVQVLSVATDLELFTSPCVYLPFDDILDSAKCGNTICRLPLFPQYLFQ